MHGGLSFTLNGASGEDGFKAAMIAADAIDAIGIDSEMTNVAGDAAMTLQNFSTAEYCAAYASAEGEQNSVGCMAGSTPFDFASKGDAGIVIGENLGTWGECGC